MNPQSDPAIPNPDAVHQRVMAGVKAHRIKLGVLTTTAFVLGFLAVVTSLVVVWSYPVFILPKQKAMQEEALKLMDQLKTNAISSTTASDTGKQFGRLLAVEIQMANVTTGGTAVIAAAVGFLGLGTLTLITVVILNRRVALGQISASLAEISGRLRESPKEGGAP